MNRALLFVALVALPLGACGGASSPARAVVGGACGFVAPAKLAGVRGTWLGGCRNGKAEGAGVVRTQPPGGQPVLWFGAMAGGRPGHGVVSRNGDYYPEAGDNRAANVRLFNAAAAGARAAARSLAAKNNAASARFYENEAVKLERTLD